MTATRRPLCPRCKKRPIAEYGGRGRRPKYCGERTCYEDFYARQRQEATDIIHTETVQLALLLEKNRLRDEMKRKVEEAVGTESKSGPRITEALPRGGALVILSPHERNEVLAGIAALDDAIRQASQALGKSRLLAYREISRDLQTRRRILDRLGDEYLLGVIPDHPRGSRRSR